MCEMIEVGPYYGIEILVVEQICQQRKTGRFSLVDIFKKKKINIYFLVQFNFFIFSLGGEGNFNSLDELCLLKYVFAYCTLT